MFRMATKPKKMDIEDYAPLSAGSEAHWEVSCFSFEISVATSPPPRFREGLNHSIFLINGQLKR